MCTGEEPLFRIEFQLNLNIHHQELATVMAQLESAVEPYLGKARRAAEEEIVRTERSENELAENSGDPSDLVSDEDPPN